MNLTWLLSFVSISFLLNACTAVFLNQKERAMTESSYNIPENCNFMNITSSNSFENECTPKLLEPNFSKFSGLLINAPKEVIWPRHVSRSDYPAGLMGEADGPLRLMVAGLARVKYSYMNFGGDCSYEVLLVAVNQKTAQAYSGKMSRGDIMWEEPPPFDGPPPATALIDAYEASRRDILYDNPFTLDLVHDLNLPITDAIYTVYATLGELKSNELTIKVKVE